MARQKLFCVELIIRSVIVPAVTSVPPRAGTLHCTASGTTETRETGGTRGTRRTRGTRFPGEDWVEVKLEQRGGLQEDMDEIPARWVETAEATYYPSVFITVCLVSSLLFCH